MSAQADAQRARYRARRDAGRCVRCNAGGDDDTMIGAFCRECYMARSVYVPSKRATANRRARAVKRYAERYADPAFREAEVGRMAERYADRKARGICTLCGSAKAAEDSGLCPEHRDSERKRIREAARRRRAKAKEVTGG